MLSANVFRQDAFSAITLTEMVNRFPYHPDFLGTLGIFEDMPILTTAVQISQKQGILSLIVTTPRGAPGVQRQNEKRAARYFETTRLFVEDTIYASELQNVVSEKNETQMLKELQEEVAIRLTGPTGLTSMMEYTWEYHRLGAVQGILLDADGSVINNWFSEFGITPPAEVGFNLAAQQPGTLLPKINQVVRTMKRAGQGAFIEGRTVVHALAGDTFYDQFIQHPDVVRTFANWQGANDGAPVLREGRTFDNFPFGGVIWHNYRGSDDNTTVAIPPDKCKFFPVGAPGVFKRVLSPGEGFESVNTRGRQSYIYRDLDPSEEQAWVRFKHKSYPLHVCTRPEMLATGHSEA